MNLHKTFCIPHGGGGPGMGPIGFKNISRLLLQVMRFARFQVFLKKTARFLRHLMEVRGSFQFLGLYQIDGRSGSFESYQGCDSQCELHCIKSRETFPGGLY